MASHRANESEPPMLAAGDRLALGDMQLRAGRAAQAEQTFRDALVAQPGGCALAGPRDQAVVRALAANRVDLSLSLTNPGIGHFRPLSSARWTTASTGRGQLSTHCQHRLTTLNGHSRILPRPVFVVDSVLCLGAQLSNICASLSRAAAMINKGQRD